MSDWDRCILILGVAEGQWREKMIPANNVTNKLHRFEVIIVNNRFEEIKNFIRTRIRNQNHGALLALRRKVQDLNCCLFALAHKLGMDVAIHFDSSLE